MADETNLTIESPSAPDDRTLVALTPADMASAQTDLLTWCDQKIAAVRREHADLETNLELATEHGWKHTSVVATLNRTAKRILYYEKLKAAVQAGYLIVPNFPIDVFAVRVQRFKQPETVSAGKWGTFATANAQLLPAGEGRYVADHVFFRDESYVEKIDAKSDTSAATSPATTTPSIFPWRL